MFDGKKILITGGSGSLGNALTEKLLESNVDTIRILSRNESKQVEMQRKFDDSRLRFLIGDIRDPDRVSRAVEDVDIVFHAAALKHVPLIEYNPNEAILTNIIGTQNVVMECLKHNVDKVIGVGTDKAVSPLNTYGATKLLMEKIIITAVRQFSNTKYNTKFSIARYGNVAASSGSVIPIFINQIRSKGKITITNPQMTRFSITMKEAVNFVISSADISVGGEVFVPKIKAYNIMDLKEALEELINKCDHEIINLRPGEKMHETLLNKYEIPYTKDLGDRFVLLDPQTFAKDELVSKETIKKYKDVKSTDLQNEYSSDEVELMTKYELKSMLQDII
ncbi:polysaccharide biosynthesis protein [Nitrosopumilus sp.]|nr:polysaccharide biosynthesis protein [Nitrosopumilus sp.]